MQQAFSKEACSFYRLLRKFPSRESYNKLHFQAYLRSLSGDPESRVAVIRASRQHMETRDEYTRYLHKYRIGVKRDERKMVENVAKMVGLSITWGEHSEHK